MKEVSISNIKTPAIDIKEAIKKSKYFKKIGTEAVQCLLCPRECKIK